LYWFNNSLSRNTFSFETLFGKRDLDGRLFDDRAGSEQVKKEVPIAGDGPASRG